MNNAFYYNQILFHQHLSKLNVVNFLLSLVFWGNILPAS